MEKIAIILPVALFIWLAWELYTAPEVDQDYNIIEKDKDNGK